MLRRRHVATNNSGYSLIELLVALVIIIVSMLAAMSTTIATLHANTDNEMRTVASRVMNQTAEALLALKFSDANLADGVHNRITNDAYQTQIGIPNTVQAVRGSQQNFAIQWSVTTLTVDASQQIAISVSYQSRNNSFVKNLTVFKHATI